METTQVNLETIYFEMAQELWFWVYTWLASLARVGAVQQIINMETTQVNLETINFEMAQKLWFWVYTWLASLARVGAVQQIMNAEQVC